MSTTPRRGSCAGTIALILLGFSLLTPAGIEARQTPPVPDPAAEPQPEDAGERPSPRALLETFKRYYDLATARNHFQELERVTDLESLNRAASCLEYDFSSFTPEERFEKVREVGQVLYYFWGEIDLDRIPGDGILPAETSAYTVEAPVLGESMPLTRAAGGWLFSRRFVGVGARGALLRLREQGVEQHQELSIRALLPAVLTQRALFLEHWQWLGIALLLIFAGLIGKIAIFVTRSVVGRLLSRQERLRATAQAAAAASRSVGLFAFAAVVALLVRFLELPPQYERIGFLLVKVITAVAAMLLCYRGADLAGARLEDAAGRTESKLDDQLAPMARKSLKILITVVALLFVLDNMEVDIYSFLAGFGVVGIGVGLAARDTFANLFGSVTVFTDKPFQVGDWVVVGDAEGTVEEIGFRTTRVRTFYNSVISLPNSKLVDTAIDNMGSRHYRRFKTNIGVCYDTPAEKIEAFCAGIRGIVQASPLVRQDYYHVYLNGFGPSSLDILVYIFFDVPDWGRELESRQYFMLEVIRLASALGVSFAFPTQSIHLESTPERPLAPHDPAAAEELDRVRQRFGPGGDLSRPQGTPLFSRKD